MSARIIKAHNVNEALSDGLWHLALSGIKSDSRNGPVIRAPGPVLTEYMLPMERLCFSPVRDANHVFHLMETIWMLAGENDVAWLLPFNSKFGQYAEDGIQHGAYGNRWRRHFRIDQIFAVVEQLRMPNNRRVVLQMWDCTADLGANVADVPCNTHVYFQVLDGALEMTVCCRSNDMIWGAYAANAVHFSMLQELIASELDVAIGSYYQFSNNLHLYTGFGPGRELMNREIGDAYDLYATGEAICYPLLAPGEALDDFLLDCRNFVDSRTPALKTAFMRNVAHPLRLAYLSRKESGAWSDSEIVECDWKLAFQQWTARRSNNGQQG